VSVAEDSGVFADMKYLHGSNDLQLVIFRGYPQMGLDCVACLRPGVDAADLLAERLRSAIGELATVQRAKRTTPVLILDILDIPPNGRKKRTCEEH